MCSCAGEARLDFQRRRERESQPERETRPWESDGISWKFLGSFPVVYSYICAVKSPQVSLAFHKSRMLDFCLCEATLVVFCACLPWICEQFSYAVNYIIICNLSYIIEIQHCERHILSGACVGKLCGWWGSLWNVQCHQTSLVNRFSWLKWAQNQVADAIVIKRN